MTQSLKPDSHQVSLAGPKLAASLTLDCLGAFFGVFVFFCLFLGVVEVDPLPGCGDTVTGCDAVPVEATAWRLSGADAD